MIIFTVGISGSGKSFFGDWVIKNYPNFRIVCPDDIRREKFGSVNNQEQGDVVFHHAYTKAISAITNKHDVFFSATGLHPYKQIKPIKKFLIKEKISVLFAYLQDSNSPDICNKRIFEDIENGKDRSDVPPNVIEKQYQKYLKISEHYYMKNLQNAMISEGLNCVVAEDTYPYQHFKKAIDLIMFDDRGHS